MALKNIQHGEVAIPRQPETPIHYSFVPGSDRPSHGGEYLLVFLSGLHDPRKIWTPVVCSINDDWAQGIARPAMLLYDRFGSGETAKKPTAEAHDAMDAAKDLRELIVFVSGKHLQIPFDKIDGPPLIFVAHSFGGVIAELYAKQYPRTVVALLLLDPAPTGTDGESWFPDPDAPDFKSEILPDGVTAVMLRKARAQQRASPYNPNTPNKEEIKWDNLSTYIPEVGTPQLIGPWENTPLLSIIGHDPQPYAEQVEKLTGIPTLLTLTYNSPNWFRYLEKLANLAPPRLRKAPVVAKGSGHFIPLEQPRLVASELKYLIQKLQILHKLQNSRL